MGLAAAEDNPEIVPLTGGVSSLIVRVDTRNGPLCIKQALPELKVASHWSAPLARNHAELAWIREVAQTLPEAVPGILGEDAQSYCFAMQWLAPEQHPVWKIQLRDGHVSPDFAAQVARQLALIHAATANQPALAERFAYDRNFFELRLDPYFGATAKVHADCAQMLQALIEQTANNRITLIHGDISPKNILAGPVGPIFLDAECAVYGDPAFDAAFCLTHLMAKCLWRPASTEDYLACFDAFTKHYLAGVDWENVEAIEARTAMLLAAILLARVDGKSPLEYLTESDRAQLRTFARRWLLSPATRLADMRAAWKEELAA
jgi:aminoglycoside phosphotransferase (APT) family kinase protein